jgi:hypothetical protein
MEAEALDRAGRPLKVTRRERLSCFSYYMREVRNFGAVVILKGIWGENGREWLMAFGHNGV